MLAKTLVSFSDVCKYRVTSSIWASQDAKHVISLRLSLVFKIMVPKGSSHLVLEGFLDLLVSTSMDDMEIQESP